MRIVIVNYRFFVAGGPERYMFNIMKMLEEAGHEVIPFSVMHDRNEPSPWSHYFLPPAGSGSEVYFGDMERPTLSQKVRGFARMVYSPAVRRSFRRMLREVKPDIVYVLYYQNKISCAVVDAAFDAGVPVVQRISDYSLLAPCSHLYNSKERSICERCLSQGPFAAVKKSCVYDSKVYSAVKALAVEVQDLRKMRSKISRFIFPSSFTMHKFIQAGYNPDKLVHIPTFFNPDTLKKGVAISYNPFALFVGRLDPDKGIATLIHAFKGTGMNLKLIGFSSEPAYMEELKQLAAGCPNIEFIGKMDFHQIQDYLSRCLFTVVPSEWYDNLPNSLLESYAFAKCVVATDTGSLSENVIDGQTGLLFDYRDTKGLREAATRLFDNPDLARQLGENGKKLVETKFNPDTHVKALEKVFEDVVENHKNKQKSKI